MSRPPVSVVMPFAGPPAAARVAVAGLLALDRQAGDELILSDNGESCGESLAISRQPGPGEPEITVVRAARERSPAHARNVGAERASHAWILFLDADTRPVPDLIEQYFAEPIDERVGALAGDVQAGPAVSFASRYGASRNFLGSPAHHRHPYLPRAVAANLLVRREAFEQLGGFYEGVRAAEDTDFSWRLQRAGWRLEIRPGARVEHHYRATLGDLRRQWRGYAAGRAWLGRRYRAFQPQPALERAAGRWLRRRGAVAPAARVRPAAGLRAAGPGAADGQPRPPAPGRFERGGFLALDAWLGIEELAGLALSNRPGREDRPPAHIVLVAERFPAPDDPLVDFARTLARARVEAVARPEVVDRRSARNLAVSYREDDGPATRAIALGRLLIRHPLRSMVDRIRRRPGEIALAALAPAVLRLDRDHDARVYPLGGADAPATARRLAVLSGRDLDSAGR